MVQGDIAFCGVIDYKCKMSDGSESKIENDFLQGVKVHILYIKNEIDVIKIIIIMYAYLLNSVISQFCFKHIFF